jgi:SAM-dependent methyltransferase
MSNVPDAASNSWPVEQPLGPLQEDAPSPSSPYPGTANLEAMEAAHNYHRFLASVVMTHADLTRPVLDFGAGTGTHARTLRDRGTQVSCVEPDPLLRRRLEQDGFRVEASVLDYGPQAFASIYSINVLEHLEDDAAALREMFRVIQPGGHLILYVPAFQVLFSAMDRTVGHLRRYRDTQLAALVHGAGFRVTCCSYVDSLGFLATLAYRSLPETGRLNRKSVALYDRFVFPPSRALDRLTTRWFGKNLLVVACRD